MPRPIQSTTAVTAHKHLRLCLALVILASLLVCGPRLVTILYALPRMYAPETVPPKRVAIVFGAEIYRDGTPSAILKDRIEAAVALYQAGKVAWLLMSGDNQFPGYNEPAAMRRYAMQLGVPEQAIVMDAAGLRTYDTCYRAGAVFGVDDAILVTQGWHLQRALFTCNMLGVQAIGVPSDGPRRYSLERRTYWALREVPATLGAFWDVWISHPLPVLGTPEPMVEGSGIARPDF